MVLSSGADPSTAQQTKGADPRTGKLKGENVLLPWCPGPPCPVLPCRGFSRLGSQGHLPCPCGFPSVFSFFWPRASRSSSRMGGTSGQTSFPFRLTGTDPSTGFSRYPFSYLTLEFHFVVTSFLLYFVSLGVLVVFRWCSTFLSLQHVISTSSLRSTCYSGGLVRWVVILTHSDLVIGLGDSEGLEGTYIVVVAFRMFVSFSSFAHSSISVSFQRVQ